MKPEVKHIQRAIPDGLKQKRQNRAAKLKADKEKSQCKPKLVTVEEAITVLDIHKFLNRQNESFLDETIVSQKTDMMGMKQNPSLNDRASAQELSGGYVSR